MNPTQTRADLRLALPKGRMQRGVIDLLAEAGVDVRASARGYRPELSVPGLEAKLLKPQNILEMLGAGSRDLGFAGADWVQELEADVVELVDTGLDPVRLVAAAPADLLEGGALPARPLRVATEYPRLAASWVEARGLDARVLRTYGATEVFPPEDADVIVDVTQTGATLAANDLTVLDTLCASSTRLYASPEAYQDPARREAIDRIADLVRSVLAGRSRVLVEVNVPREQLEAVCDALPCMDRPTVSVLAGEGGFAVKAAIPRQALFEVLSDVRARGGRDVLVSRVAQILR